MAIRDFGDCIIDAEGISVLQILPSTVYAPYKLDSDCEGDKTYTQTLRIGYKTCGHVDLFFSSNKEKEPARKLYDELRNIMLAEGEGALND